MRTRLRAGPVHVLHFIGHGDFDPDWAEGYLVLEDEASKGHPINASDLATLLATQPTLRLVFLNACQGAQTAAENLFGGIAYRLGQQGIPGVIAMQFPVTDDAAIALSEVFYRGLADGLPVDTALTRARQAIAVDVGSVEWATAVLFSRAPDNQLLRLPEGDALLTIPRQDWEPDNGAGRRRRVPHGA